jgi:hypothetical protein
VDDYEIAEAVYRLPAHEREVVQEMHSRVEQVIALPRVIFDEAQPMLIRQSCLDAFYIHVRMLAEFLLRFQRSHGPTIETRFTSRQRIAGNPSRPRWNAF